MCAGSGEKVYSIDGGSSENWRTLQDWRSIISTSARQRAIWLAVRVLCQEPVTKFIKPQFSRVYYTCFPLGGARTKLLALASAMNSLDEECTPHKAKYDECFNAWFRDSFLKGKAEVGHDQACGELFKTYQSCLQVWRNLMSRGKRLRTFHSGFIV